MKYFVLLCDGMSDRPCAALDGKTPMEAANKPMMDALVRHSLVGTVSNVPEGMAPGSDPANLSVMSYDPAVYSNGRSPLEAASMGLEMTESMTAFRCNILTLSDNGEPYEEKIMIDHGADEITTEEADALIKAVEEELGGEFHHFYTGVSYRHCLLWDNCPEYSSFVPPHDILDRQITDYLPTEEEYLSLMKKSFEILNNHPVNQARRERGLRPANSIWLWSPGKKPALPDFYEKWHLSSTVISAVDLIKGIAKCAGMKTVNVPGATGNINTNYDGKANAAIEAFKQGDDYVYMHIEAPDECGHRGEAENKVRSIELIDEKVLTPVYNYLKGTHKPFKIMVLPDHPTPIEIKTHSSESVPFFIYSSEQSVPGTEMFSEKLASETGVYVPKGHRLMELLTSGSLPESCIRTKRPSSMVDFLELFALSVIIVIMLMTFVLRHSPVVGSSMENTLKEDDILIVSPLDRKPDYGHIVIIQTPRKPDEPIVKRVIGLEGDTVKIDYNSWDIWVNGKLIDSSYVKKVNEPMRSYDNAVPDENGIFEGKVPSGCIFVLGDNRNVSADSRTSAIGYVDCRYIVGTVEWRVSPTFTDLRD